MGAPSSSIFSEIYLQYLENTTIYDLLVQYNIKGYFRYVEDILFVYNKTNTNTDDLLDRFNNGSPELNFTIKKNRKSTSSMLLSREIRKNSP
jgi:hypothetical protein